MHIDIGRVVLICCSEALAKYKIFRFNTTEHNLVIINIGAANSDSYLERIGACNQAYTCASNTSCQLKQ